MALKFLNKKGWHTGSLRNIENVWKAEQKHEAEQRKLEELRKQIGEEREKAEFRQLQEQAGLVPRQERLDFLYESGLGVGKGNSEGFKALQPAVAAASVSSSVPVSGESSSSKAAAPGALFEDKKPQSANDAWRKLHSDPLLLIRQREQDALAKIKNNPIKMAMIKKSVEAEKKGKEGKKEKKRHKKHRHRKSKNEKHHEDNSDSDSEASDDHGRERKGKRENLIPKSKHKKKSSGDYSDSEYSDDERDKGRRNHLKSEKGEDIRRKNEKRLSRARSDSEDGSSDEKKRRRKHDYKSERHDGDLRHEKHESRVHPYSRDRSEVENKRSDYSSSKHLAHPSQSIEEDERRKNGHFTSENGHFTSEYGTKRESYQPRYNRSKGVPKMTEEEREAKLREMQLDAELHEDQRWKRLKKAADADAQEAMRANFSKGKNFLDDAQKSIFGTEKGGSTTIEESVRRRAFYSQGSSAAHDNNAFRR